MPAWKSRKSKKDGKDYRGLSRNQCCICTATDGHRCILACCGMGKPGSEKIMGSYSSHIERGAMIHHDGENGHSALVKDLALTSIVHDSRSAKKLRDGENPMEPINEVHRMLKLFLHSHKGYSRSELQDWLNLFCFIWNGEGDNAKKAQEFIEKAVEKCKIMRYREWKKVKKVR